MLHVEVRGHGDPVVLLHGFTQSSATWAPITARLEQHHTVVAFDAPGHGASSSVRATLVEGADLMAAAAPAPAAWVGYSMGGRFAIEVALRHPEALSRLVLVSTTAGIEDPAEREARRVADAALAEKIEAEGVEAFLRWWLARPLFATLPPEASALDSRLGSSAAGLASSLRLAGAAEQDPVWHLLGFFPVPVLVVTGELDTKYCALGERLAAAIGPSARHEVITGAGHACHLERPEEFVALVEPFLAGKG